VLRVILKLDGEKVLGTECVIGYLHRGVEKIAENRTYTMFNPYVDRMDYCAAVSNGWATRSGREADECGGASAAQYIRVILTELNRIASHQLWLGTHALDIGAMTPLFYTFATGRRFLDFRTVLRGRLTTHAFPHRRLPVRDLRGGRKGRHEFPELLCAEDRRIRSAAYHQPHLLERTKNVGVISAADAIALGVTGPVLRASGVKWTCAKRDANYSKFDFEIPIGENGDTYDRYLCGWRDAPVDAHIEQGGWRHSRSPIMGKVPKVIKPPVGEIYHSIEARRAKLGISS